MSVAAHFNRQRVQIGIGAIALLLVFVFIYNTLLKQDRVYYPSISDSRRVTYIAPHKDLPKGDERVSRLHYLVPSNTVRDTLCAGVTSALANGYPIPRILGYKGTGEFDAKAAHIAKLRAIKRYLYAVNATTTSDDDLVIVVDGFDVLPQMPAEIMIERYFDLTAYADRKLANQRGVDVEELHAMGLRQTLIWGTDKGCFPGNGDLARCWLLPLSDLGPYAWGPKTKWDGYGDMPYSDPRFLNSGTVMGPLGDLRKFMDATLDYIEEVWDDDFKFKNSDQYYISTLYGRQEFQRILDLGEGKFPIDPKGKKLPEPSKGPDDETEYHVFVDFEAAFAQTRCHNDQFMQKLQYKTFDLTATVTTDPFGDEHNFREYTIQMPNQVYRGLESVWDKLDPADRPEDSAKKWINTLNISTNVATKWIFPFYHHTCQKSGYIEKHQDSWYFPLIQQMMRASRRDNEENKPLHPRLVDGRLWVAPSRYPRDSKYNDEFGGVFTDLEEEPFIPLQKFCKADLTTVIGERSKH